MAPHPSSRPVVLPSTSRCGAFALTVREGPRRPRESLDALVECARAGDANAFQQVTEQFEKQLVRYVSGVLRGDVDTASDVVQDTFLTAWHKLDTIRDGGHLRPWLYRVARCKAITWLRRRGPRGTPMDSLELAVLLGHQLEDEGRGDPARAPSSEGPVAVEALREAIARLPPNYAGVIRLYYLHGCDTQETADLLGVPRTTVKMRLYRARQLLRKLLRKPGAGP